jgi:hypothetical protein
MEPTNLIYNRDFRLLICIEHDYCVAPKSLRYHLNSLHGVKGERLRAALIEANTLQARDPRQALPPLNAPAIPHLPIDLGYRCGILACKRGKPFVSKSKRTVEKHLSKEHDVGHAKGKTKLTIDNIEEVRVQSFLSFPHYLAFVVQVPVDLPQPPPAPSASAGQPLRAKTPPHANPEADEETSPHAGLDNLETQYLSSQQLWHKSHEHFLPDEDQYVKQTPPWIRSTGIRDWLQGLGVEKNSISGACSPLE